MVCGVYLVGSGNIQGGTQILWGGSLTATPMVAFLGPMKGWDVRNSVKLIAVSNGDMQHDAFNNRASTAVSSRFDPLGCHARA
jgi:hypothetical protein